MMLDLNNKMTNSTTNNLVNILYLQWAYIITLASFLFMSKELVDGCDGRCIAYPMIATFLLGIFLYMSSIVKTVKTMMGFVKSKKRLNKADTSSSEEDSETSSSESVVCSSSSLLKSEQTKAKMTLFLKDPSSSSEDSGTIGSVKSGNRKAKDVTKSSVEDSKTSSSEISQSPSSLLKSEKTKARMGLFRKDQSTPSKDLSVKSGKKKTKKVVKSSAEDSNSSPTENSEASTSSPVKSEKTKAEMVLFRSDQSASSKDSSVKSEKKTKKVKYSGTSSSENSDASNSSPVESEKTKMANRVLFKQDQSTPPKLLAYSEAASGSETEMLEIPTAYMLWFNEVGRDMVMEENPDLELKDVSREAGKIWRKMDEEEKDMWEKKLIQLQRKYEEEKKKLVQ